MVLQKHLISPQYLNKSQITVTILDVLSPDHFVVKESPSLDGSFEAKNFIEAEEAMQKYYESVEPCFFQLPLKDTIIVAFVKDKFYRAKVIGILSSSAGHKFTVYLVDYGLECKNVERECIYEISKDFLEHPFQAVNFKLIGIEPVSLVVNDKSLNVSYGPVSYWDSSAKTFVEGLQKEMCNAYIEILTTDEKYMYGKLFICYGNDKIRCINDELVLEKFARFTENSLESVQNVGKSVGNTNSGFRMSRTPESSKLQESTSKQMSSISSSDSELDFKMKFVSPEGKIVAESSLAECSTTEDNLQSESIGQKKFLRLQQLHRKKLRSPISPSNDVCSTGRNLPTAECTIDVEMSPSNDSSVQIKHLDNSSSKDCKVDNETISPSKSSVSSAINSSNLNEKPCVDVNQVATMMSPRQENISEDQLIAQKRFEKLRQLSRKKLKSPIQADSTSIKSSPAEIEIETNLTNISIESTKDRCDISLNSLSSDSLKASQSNTSSNFVEVPTESSPKQENISEDQLIAHKRFEKLQLMARKKLKSPILANSTCIKNSPTETEIAANMTSVLMESTENRCDISMKSLSSYSPETFQPNVDKNCIEIPTESSSKQENISEVVLEHVNTLQRLRNRVRRKLMDSPLQLIDEPSDVKQIFADTDQVQTSSSSILSDCLGQIYSEPRTERSQI